MVGQVTQMMLPCSTSRIASAPRGSLAAARIAAAEATTYTIPMIASCGTRPLPDERVRAKTPAPTPVNSSEETNAVWESGATPVSNATTLPRAAIWASERSTKITSRAITCSPRYEWIPTSTMQATNGASMNVSMLGLLGLLLSRSAGRAERPRQLRDPEVDEVEVRIDPRGTADVHRDDHGLGPGPRGDLFDLVPVVVVRREQHLNLPLLHLRDDLLHVTRRGRDARLGLDVIHARDLELAGEVVPLLVVAHDLLAAERHPLLEPAAQARHERRALVLVAPQEVEQPPLTVEVGQRLPAEQLHQLVAVKGAVDPVFELLLLRRDVVV